MPITIKGNYNIHIGKDAIRLEGYFKDQNVEVSDNYSAHISGNAIKIVHFQEIRDQFPELTNVSDREMAQAVDAVKGKSFDGAISTLQNMAAFTTIITANWPALLQFLGWSE